MKCIIHAFLLLLMHRCGSTNAASLYSEKEYKWEASSITEPDGSRVFYLVSGFPMNYDESFVWCQNQGGIMAEPRSSDQTDILNAYSDGQSVEANYWIGS